jgi:hypothetical protein
MIAFVLVALIVGAILTFLHCIGKMDFSKDDDLENYEN